MTQVEPTRDRDVQVQQLTLLRLLIGELRPANRFYEPLLDEAGLDASVASLEEYRRRMPLTTKAQLVADQSAHPPYGSNLTYPLHRYTRFNQTSGTTAAPIRWLDTPTSWQALLDCWKQVYRAADVGADDRVYFAFSFGPFLGFWTAFEAAAQLGCLCLPGGGLTSAARLGAILDNEATVLCCTPTYALRLAEVAAAEHIDLASSKVRRIIVAGESGGSVPAVRDRIEQAWPAARVFDHHGMTEVGPVTYEDPRRPGTLRVIESAYLAEVIDPRKFTPVAPGEVGELVLTTLLRTGSPLLRYRTGDLVRPVYIHDDDTDRNATASDHSGALALEGGILGRCDDMIVVRGVNIFPSAIDQILRASPDVAEYRVNISERSAMTHLQLIVEPAPGSDPTQVVRSIGEAVRRAIHLRVEVVAASPGELPRFEMKARRWIRHHP